MTNSLLAPEEKDIRWFSNDESYPPEEREEEEEEQEESGFDPMRMAALQAGASLLRHSGPRYTPMSFGQAVGHAIPAGIQGYYQQDAMNQQEQQAMLERQQAEQEALTAKQTAEAEASQKQALRINFEAALKNMGISHKDQTWFLSIYDADPKEAHKLLEERMTKEKKGEEKFRILDPDNPDDAKLLKGFKKDRLWQISSKNDKITEVAGTMETPEEKKASRLTMDEAMLAGYPEATAIPPLGGLRLNKDGTRTIVDRYGKDYTGPKETNQFEGYVLRERLDEKGNTVAFWTNPDPAKPDIDVKGTVKTKEEEKIDPYSGYTLVTRETEDGNTEQFYSHPDKNKPDIPVDGFKERVKVDPEVATLATGDLSLGNPQSEGYKAAETHLAKAGFRTPEELKKDGITSVKVMRDSNGNMSFEFKNAQGHTMTESAAHELKEDAQELAEERFEFDQDKFKEQTKHWEIEHKENFEQRAKENGWKEERIEREIASHNISLKQQQKNLDSGTDYLSRQEFIAKYGDTLPEDVAQVEIDKNGTIKKMLKEDWTERNVPLNALDTQVLQGELENLYTQYPEIFTAQKKSGINLLMQGDDPMLALKEAHNELTREEVLAQPPAMIMKMYNVDLGVMESAQAALDLINKEEEVAKRTGIVIGRITPKLMKPVVQAFASLRTEAGLIKRNEMIGSQMTDGEIKFSTPFFPDPTDTVSSAKVKLQILLRVSRKRSQRIKSMFSKKAGYNDEIWVDPSYASVNVDAEGNITEPQALDATTIED